MRVLLDTCVLYPTVMREMLLGAAGQGLYTPLWSPRILEEWARAARKLGDLGEIQARSEIALLKSAWPKAQIEPRQGDLARLWLPDENDIHVLAAAVAGSADLILTLNASDFPRNILAEEGLGRDDPDHFLLQLWQDNPDKIAATAQSVQAAAERIDDAPHDLRKLLKKARLPRLAKALSA